MSGAYGMSRRGIAVRIFLTCWLVYALHFATNIVREIYPAVSLGDHFSFRVDEYAGMHPDLFEKEGYGWHIGNNPGASMLAAIPYALARPVIDPIVDAVQHRRQASGRTEPPAYDSPWPMARQFYAEAWRRGVDIKLGLAAWVMHAFCMAPSSALGAVLVFWLLCRVLPETKHALWMTLLFAFGTPVFFRTGFLNHNLMLGFMALLGFAALWSPDRDEGDPSRGRIFLAGTMGGGAVLFDYSGVVFLLALFAYATLPRWSRSGPADALRSGAVYVAGTVPPIALLMWYQWRSFGHPIYPGQHWMPPVEWIDRGYQGYGPPQLELLWMLLADHRFGLFVTCPLLLFGVWRLLRRPAYDAGLPRAERWFLLLTFVGLWVFFAGSNYTRLQFNTGIRYLIPIVPFLFLPAAAALVRLRRPALYGVAVVSLLISWPLAMVRDVETGPGILNPVVRVLAEGPQLPALTTLSRMSESFGGRLAGVPALALFALAATLVGGIWLGRFRRGR